VRPIVVERRLRAGPVPVRRCRRRAMAPLLKGLKSGGPDLKQVLNRDDDLAGRTRVLRLFRSLPGIGPAGAARWMDELDISENRCVRVWVRTNASTSSRVLVETADLHRGVQRRRAGTRAADRSGRRDRPCRVYGSASRLGDSMVETAHTAPGLGPVASRAGAVSTDSGSERPSRSAAAVSRPWTTRS
jgi:hypothetical protein